MMFQAIVGALRGFEYQALTEMQHQVSLKEGQRKN
jgi:hypothetical protein